MEPNSGNNSQNIVEEKKKNGLVKFIFNHKMVFFLIVCLLILFAWAKFKIYFLEKNYSEQQKEIINNYELKIDSLTISRMELTAKTFSWAIRSELMRENLEQVDQFFLNFIREPEIKKLQLLNPENGAILLSTDKKDEGQFVADDSILKAEFQKTINDSVMFKIITPIMGLNNKIGIVVIDIEK